MADPLKFFIVDDDRIFTRFMVRFLEADGHRAAYTTSSIDALQKIRSFQPDCVLLDIMMPQMDGFELCRLLRAEPSLPNLKIVMVTGKTYEFDRRRAFSLGADGYLVKPVDPKAVGTELRNILEDRMRMTFWGIRGTLPVPGAAAVRYGGNTSCVSLEFPKGMLFVFDAGTGIKELSNHLAARKQRGIDGKIFISHPHWDHINALPFFAPLYRPGNEFDIYGPSHGDITVRDLIAGQMDGVYFPIQIKEFAATVSFYDLREELLQFEGITVRTKLLNHPGHCLGYRASYRNRSVCYVTDHEIYPAGSPHYNAPYLDLLTEFVAGADALITDATYSDAEYIQKRNWGHSAISEVVGLAHRARVKTLYLIHHDPDQTDDDIDAKLTAARALLGELESETVCRAPAERESFKI